MILDNGSLMFNMNMKTGGTPSWGTDMGQGEGYKFNFEDMEEMMTSLVYTCVDDMENVKCEFGKGGSRTDDYNIILAGLYKKVYVNDELLNDAQFLLVVAKQIKNPSGYHIGRKTLKYGPNMTYNEVQINKECFELIKKHFDLNDSSAWFINEIKTKNQDEVHLKVYIADKEKSLEFDETNERKEFIKKLTSKDDIKEKKLGGYNKIYYGAPGTGKSYEIDNVILKDLSKEEKEERVIRITFHPEYTYSDFIGQLIPIIEKDADGNDKITYDFKIGPFTAALKKSYETNEMIYLVIEEMSRGNCAAIFGDIFQLLDRNKDGESTYDITNDIIAEKVFGNKDVKVKIPTNLTILGTVNTSDQNVYVMDTAFKRRFEWKYIPIIPAKEDGGSKGYKNNAEIELKNSEEIKKYKWIDFYMALNKFIASNEYLGLGEDKQIGQFFIKFDFEEAKDREKIENKLLHYLWFDIQESSFKSDKKLFAEKISDFGDLFIKYTTNEQIFSDEFFKLLNDYRWEK